MKSLLKTAVCMVLMIAVVIPMTAVNASAAKPKISRTSADVPIGYSVTVKVTGASSVKWSSSDESVAAVTADGASAKITGKKTGSATITAKAGSTALKCKVTVKKSFITPSAESVSISEGKSKTITIKVSGAKDIALSNSDKDVCSTSWGKWDGNTIKLTVKAKSKGSAVIKVYTQKYSKSTAEEIKITVGEKSADDVRADKIVELVNKERKDAGVPAVKADSKLNEVAAVRAKELAEKYDHIRPDGTKCFTALDDADYGSYLIAAENIANDYNNDEEHVMNLWMTSKKGHKENILNESFTKMGVGYYEADGRYYWVQIFVG